jgi:GTP-binding protein
MIINSSVFIKSCKKNTDLPKDDLVEIAFVGRSNVGKSSLINMILNHKNLAKTSQKPGKTKLINFFLVNNKWRLVDLPGYGWAQVSKKEKDEWKVMIDDYLLNRKQLQLVFVLIDSRLSPQRIDLDFINFLGENSIPLSIVFTKIDKLSKNVLKKNIDIFLSELKISWDSIPVYFQTSCVSKEGRNEILKFLDSFL